MNDQPAAQKRKINRHSERVPSEALRLWLKDNDKHETAQAIGIHASSMAQWIVAGQMPKWMLTSLEALKRRQAKGEDPTVYLVAVPQKTRDAFRQFISALELPFNIVVLPRE